MHWPTASLIRARHTEHGSGDMARKQEGLVRRPLRESAGLPEARNKVGPPAVPTAWLRGERTEPQPVRPHLRDVLELSATDGVLEPLHHSQAAPPRGKLTQNLTKWIGAPKLQGAPAIVNVFSLLRNLHKRAPPGGVERLERRLK